eukprot:CAMPEP_0194083292 /NCGR_PEP_ID=MMETSP0149-20130528/8887_1 /TAXON_ID=122233 /ORGANISM="Chaetoceros debilis, Strain MM31A-1" /LENGTH=1367 /DNA_ID=CAMNT_0038765669 /DNA_START=178 /DNA_END=4281 /DNA_ORIENTATION=+
MASPHSPLPPTVADRDAEIAALQTAFDEYIASSRELEDELDAELAKMQEKLAESSAANAALISQLESLNPQLSSLEKALSETKKRLEAESATRRKSELSQDEAEARAREAEASLEKFQVENEQVHEQLAFREEEVEEMRLELEVEKERHSVELEELAAQIVEASKNTGNGNANGTAANGTNGHAATNGNAKSPDGKRDVSQHKDDISVMTEDEDFVTLAVGSHEAAGDDQEDYIKRLEDELEDVTEQLIEAETNISNMEGKLGAAEKKKAELEEKVDLMETNMEDLQEKTKIASEADEAKADLEAATAAKDSAKEELALVTEELTLTQEELKAAEEDAKAAAASLDAAKVAHKAELSKLKKVLEETKGSASNVDVEVNTLQKALNDANAQTEALREEVKNLTEALENAKNDHSKTMEEMDDLRQAFDEAEGNVRQASAEREEDLVKEHLREIQDLQAELLSIQEANNAMKKSAELASGPSAAEIDLLTKLDQKQKELERVKVELSDERKENVRHKRKIEELSAGNRALVAGALDAPKKRTEIMASPIQALKSIDMDEEEEQEQSSEFFRSHARSRRREAHEPSKRSRSSSPTTVIRLEREISTQTTKINKLNSECESLKSQKRMSDVRVKHLEKDVAKLHDDLEKAEEKSDNLVMKVVESGLQNPEARDDKDLLDGDVEKVLTVGSKEELASEFRALARRSTLQKEHNAQLLVKILKLQGNIQVCCRIRPLTNGEIKRGIKRVVEPLSESEVGCFDERTKNWKSFAFDKVWGPDSHQLGIFQDVEPLALSVVDGYNACIFAYGQTGSGKTYTMEGSQGIERGISFRTVEKVFNLLNYRVMKQDTIVKKYEQAQESGNGSPEEEQGRFTFEINVGMLEIYNDSVYDLLVPTNKKTALDIKRNKNGQIETAGLIKEPVTSVKDVITLLKRGNKSRATAATDMNEHSSRSHMVLTVDVKSGIQGEEPAAGTLYLVDLAGSERVRKSGVEGANLREATQINKSLSALGNVMEALDRKASHIPYRDSKLTYLLQDSLGGNSRTMMVVTCCPTSSSFDETKHALEFATRVRRINIGSAKRNVASKNLEETVKHLNYELKALAKSKRKSEEQLVSLKRDHTRIQDRLKTSSESRAKSMDEARTLTVLKSSNTQMTARWQKEKQLHDKAVVELESAQNDAKQLQSQLSKAKRDTDRMAKIVAEKESEHDVLKSQLRDAKVTSSAANLRARKAQMLQSRPSNAGPGKASHIVKPTPRSDASVARINKMKDADPAEAREKVLAMLKDHDPKKVDKIDAIMDRFKGREGFLLVKMTARYEGVSPSNGTAPIRSTSNGGAGGSRPGSAAQKRSEMAMARHMERMRSKKKMATSGRNLRD